MRKDADEAMHFDGALVQVDIQGFVEIEVRQGLLRVSERGLGSDAVALQQPHAGDRGLEDHGHAFDPVHVLTTLAQAIECGVPLLPECKRLLLVARPCVQRRSCAAVP